jgi:hypothetical protein
MPVSRNRKPSADDVGNVHIPQGLGDSLGCALNVGLSHEKLTRER